MQCNRWRTSRIIRICMQSSDEAHNYNSRTWRIRAALVPEHRHSVVLGLALYISVAMWKYMHVSMSSRRFWTLTYNPENHSCIIAQLFALGVIENLLTAYTIHSLLDFTKESTAHSSTCDLSRFSFHLVACLWLLQTAQPNSWSIMGHVITTWNSQQTLGSARNVLASRRYRLSQLLIAIWILYGLYCVYWKNKTHVKSSVSLRRRATRASHAMESSQTDEFTIKPWMLRRRAERLNIQAADGS